MPTTVAPATDAIEHLRLQLALASARLGVFEVHLRPQRIVWANARMYEIHGWPLQAPPTPDEVWDRIVDPEDLRRVRQAYARSVEPRSSVELRHRIRRASDGAVRHVEVLAAWQGDGEQARLIGVMRDVTEHERLQQGLHAAHEGARRQAEVLQSVMDHVPEGITIAFGRDAVIHSVSRHGVALTGRDVGQLSGIDAGRQPQCWQIFHPDGRTLATPEELPLTRACRGDVIDGEEWALRATTGRLVPILCNAGPIRDAGGETVGGVIAWRDISALKRIEAERAELLQREQRLREAAQEANRTKDAFIARLSHELRTPLAAVMGWARVIRSKAGDCPELVHAARVIEHNASLQAALLEDLLDMSRILAGRFTLRCDDIDLSEVVLHAIDSIIPQAQARHVTIDGDVGPGLRLHGDAVRLQQVVWNLLSNAVKFSRPGGQVRVYARRLADDLELRVEDQGEGIAPAHLEQVFQPFWQVDDAAPEAGSGLGLGLSIVRSIVVSHGGTVRAESDGPGAGAVFVVRLPVRACADEAAG